MNQMQSAECRVQNDLAVTSREAHFVWSMVPADCKSSLARLKASGRWEEARPEILREAEAGLRLLGSYTLLDVCAALELAAEHWLVDRLNTTKGAA